MLTDHLERPIMMTDESRNVVWQASYLPFGEVRSITGTATLNQRFPGQWYQLETGLAYNWHRHYDPSIGRYLQPDPLGMPDGPSRWAYAKNSPLMLTDREGLQIVSRNLPKPNTPLMCQPVAMDAWCKQKEKECIDLCSEIALPTGNDGFKFWNCQNECMRKWGC